MDILIHILIIVIIGGFFFIDKYSASFNPMMFVIIFSILGLVMLQVSNIEYVDTAVLNKINSTSYSFNTIDLTSTGLGLFNVQSFFVLIYWWFMILGVLNIALGRKDSQKNE